MPIYDFLCVDEHRQERYVHVLGVETMLCACGQTMSPVGFGFGQTWFRENAGRVIHNLGPEPVTIHSAEEHKAAMKAAGVEWSTGWAKKKTGGWV